MAIEVALAGVSTVSTVQSDAVKLITHFGKTFNQIAGGFEAAYESDGYMVGAFGAER